MHSLLGQRPGAGRGWGCNVMGTWSEKGRKCRNQLGSDRLGSVRHGSARVKPWDNAIRRVTLLPLWFPRFPRKRKQEIAIRILANHHARNITGSGCNGSRGRASLDPAGGQRKYGYFTHKPQSKFVVQRTIKYCSEKRPSYYIT